MATTSPWGIPLVDDTMPVSPLEGLINPLAVGMNAAMTLLATGAAPRVGSVAARLAMFPSPQAGYKVQRTDTGITERYDGTNWKAWESDWISYTPTLSVASGTTKWVGTTGTNTAEYKYSSGRIWVRAKFTFGNTIASTYTNPQFALPFAAANFYVVNQFINSTVTAADVGNAIFSGYVRFTSTTTAGFAMVTASGTPAGLGPTNPATWGSGDFVSCDFVYDPA